MKFVCCIDKNCNAAYQFGPERKMMNRFVLIKAERDEEKEIWAGVVLLLFSCAVRGGERG